MPYVFLPIANITFFHAHLDQILTLTWTHTQAQMSHLSTDFLSISEKTKRGKTETSFSAHPSIHTCTRAHRINKGRPTKRARAHAHGGQLDRVNGPTLIFCRPSGRLLRSDPPLLKPVIHFSFRTRERERETLPLALQDFIYRAGFVFRNCTATAAKLIASSWRWPSRFD